jgi:hypothetical protein
LRIQIKLNAENKGGEQQQTNKISVVEEMNVGPESG